MEFLAGLNPSFEAQRARVLDSKIPSLDVYEVVNDEEDKKREMNHTTQQPGKEAPEDLMTLTVALRIGRPPRRQTKW